MRDRLIIAVAALVLATAAEAAAGTAEKYSGTIVALDVESGALILAAIGPFDVGTAATEIIERKFKLTRDTSYSVLVRVTTPTRLAEDVIEVPLMVADLTIGTFVTIDGTEHEGRLVARKISFVFDEENRR